MKQRFILIVAILPFIFGCTSFVKKSPSFDESIKNIKTIAVMPPDIRVYRLTAGGVKELVDEWSNLSKELTHEALREHLADRYGFEIKFIAEEWLKKNHKAVWNKNKALYGAVASSALVHAYSGPNKLRSKIKNFDYTLGEEVSELAGICGADALLFIHGADHEATVGRVALWWWNFSLAVVTGVSIFPTNPSNMTMGLVDGTSGDVTWFKISNPKSEYSFRNKKHINNLVEWFTRDFVTKK